MRLLVLLVPGACAAAALGLALARPAAPAAPRAAVFGVADDFPLQREDAGAALDEQLVLAGLSSIRIPVLWDARRPRTIIERERLEGAVAEADAAGLSVDLAVRPQRAADVGGSPGRARAFARFAAAVAAAFPQADSIVVGNEPNQPRFWQPQFRHGRTAAPADYERLLALTYDAVKRVRPTLRVIGLAISSRGNDNPAARSNASISPLRFLHDLGAAYRRSHRRRPLMDALGFHPYPRSSTDPISRGFNWPNAGFPNLPRLKQAVWDAFSATPQPTIEDGLPLVLDEVGWQVAVEPDHADGYRGAETVAVTTEAAQAAAYADAVRRVACDPSVAQLNILPFVDDPDLAGFQSGLLRADGSERPALAAVESAIARGCTGRTVSWRHARRVAGARAVFPAARRHWTRQRVWGFSVRAAEGATYRASIVRMPVRSTQGAARAVAVSRGRAPAGWSPRVVFRTSLAPGRYAYVVELRAQFAPARRARFVSAPFTVG